MMEKFSAMKPCPICKGNGFLAADAFANARYYSTSPATKRVKCWNCVDGFVPASPAYKALKCRLSCWYTQLELSE
jgi:hypothetical protein